METASTVGAARHPGRVLSELKDTLSWALRHDDTALDAHEEEVVRALNWILEGSHSLGDVDLGATKLTPEDRILLEIVLALHDIGKRGDHSGPHAEAGYLLLAHHRVDLQEAIARYVEDPAIAASLATRPSLRLILWLVRYHEVLEELYQGERRAISLDLISAGLCKNCDNCARGRRCRECRGRVARALCLLLIVAVCDCLGRVSRDALRTRIAFWRKLIEMDQRERFRDLSHRLTQWTSHDKDRFSQDSPARQSEANEVWQKLSLAARDAFSSRINHIVGGAELFRALPPRWRSRLLNEIANHYAHNFNTEDVTLSFARPYDPAAPGAASLLAQYEKAVRNGRLIVAVNYGRREIHVDCPVGRR